MVHDEFKTVTENTEPQGDRKLGPLKEGIELNDVSFAYREDDGDVLKNIDIEVPVNTMVAFVGESGAGKSTLIDMLTLLLRPRDGEIRIDGVRHDEIALSSWRSQIGYVSQETVVFDDTIANNISLWSHEEGSTDSIEEAARKAHAHHFIEDLPDGYETVVGDRGVRLSGGQRQRLFIARELFKRPNLLILDEATSALDTESERHIQESIDGLKGQMTVVIIAHRLSTIKNVDRVFVMDDGRVVEDGTYDHLRNNNSSRFRSMVEMQQV
jgi:subfamily B ATP-binding cassette protein MsbA